MVPLKKSNEFCIIVVKMDEANIISKIDLCTAAFEKISNTLITKMGEIVNKLSKIASETELLGKINNQLMENNKQAQNITNLITSLNMRLDKLGNNGI